MDEVLNFLNDRESAEEASAVTFYDLYIAGFAVRVEVNDHGAGTGNLRYSVTAYSPDIPEEERIMNTRGLSLGNPDSTLRMALMNVHWNVFENRGE